MDHLLTFIRTFFGAAQFLLFLHVVLSMFLPGDRPVRIGIAKIVEPILRPFRRILKPINGIDFSPVLAMLAIYLIEWLLSGLIRKIFL
jgi:YggT family protein